MKSEAMTVEQVLAMLPSGTIISRITRDDREECIAMTADGGVYQGRPTVEVTFILPPYQVERAF